MLYCRVELTRHLIAYWLQFPPFFLSAELIWFYTKLNTFQHIDTSLHILVLESSVNPLCGCVTKQPLVIKPFICPSDTFSMLLFFPRKMFFDESNPAAYTCDVKGKLYSHIILKANLDIVLCTVCVSELSLLLLLELYQLLQN